MRYLVRLSVPGVGGWRTQCPIVRAEPGDLVAGGPIRRRGRSRTSCLVSGRSSYGQRSRLSRQLQGHCLRLADGADLISARLWIVDTLTSAERAIAARRLAAVRPVVAALAGIAAPEAFAELCRDELLGVDAATGGWDIRARWFGVIICATPRLGELGRGITISWRVMAALITAQQPHSG